MTGVHNFEFVRKHFKGIGKDSRILSWVVSNTELFSQIPYFCSETAFCKCMLGGKNIKLTGVCFVCFALRYILF